LASGTDIRLVDVWRRDDAKIAADAIALRRKLSLLPASVSPEDRAKELCAATYLQNELIGVSTMVIDILPQLKARFDFFRCLVAPQHRQQGLAVTLGAYSRNLLAN
jgi:hypothetical protein